MRKLNELKNVSCVAFGKNGILIIGNGNYVSTSDFNSFTLEKAYGSRPIVVLNDLVLLQEENFNKIYILDFNGSLKEEIENGFNLYQIYWTPKNDILIPCKKTKTYWVFDKDFKRRDLGKYLKMGAIIGGKVFDYSDREIMAYPYLELKLIWKVDVSAFGRYIGKHRDTGEVLSDEPNEIDGDLFGYQNLIFVPLKGGQLLALNASDGVKVWMLEHEISGAYQIIDNLIYKKNAKHIYEIDANSGEILREKKFSDHKLLGDYHASGPLWVYEDIIVIADVLSGKICLLDRASFNVFEFFTVNQKLPYTNDAIAWHMGKLYVLDLENTLHIFEKE